MTDDKYYNNTAFCPLPWTSIYVDPAGKVDSCCIANNNIGNINESKINDIVHSRKNIAIKQDMLNGTRVSGCRKCYPIDTSYAHVEDKEYSRQRHLITHESYITDKSIYDDTDHFTLTYADLRLRNTCNYACVYCDATLSSTWAVEKKIFPRIDNSHINDLVQHFCNNVKTLKEVYFAGGEPLLIKENEQLLLTLIEHNPECAIRVNTNLSQLADNKIFNLLTQLKNVQWIISGEATGAKYNYIRWPGNWDNFVNNLALLKNSIPDTHTVNYMAVYNSMNMINVFEYIDFLIEHGYAKYYGSCIIHYYNGGHHPTGLDPRVVPAPYLELANQRIQLEIAKHTKLKNNWWVDILQNILNINQMPITEPYLAHIHPAGVFDKFEYFDNARNLDSLETFPELYAHKPY